MQQISLNELYSLYADGKIKRADFEGKVYCYFFYNQDKTCISHWSQNEFEDYISWFYPRLSKAISSYQDTGSTFEAFINKFLLISSKEYRVKTTTRSIMEYSAWSARVPELYLHEDPPEYHYHKSEDALSCIIGRKKGRKSTKCILALILKCYYYVSDDFIDKIAAEIKFDKNELKDMVEKVRKIRQKRDDQIYLMKERIYCQFYRCIVYENRLSYIPENTVAYSKLNNRLKKTRERLERMRKRFSLIRTDATNRQIAQIIGISKGTVDSSLHKLKTKFNALAAKAPLN